MDGCGRVDVGAAVRNARVIASALLQLVFDAPADDLLQGGLVSDGREAREFR